MSHDETRTLFSQYSNIRNLNAGLIDSAGTSNKGKRTISEKMRTWWFSRRFLDQCGMGNVFRKGVEVSKTDNGYLAIGSNCTFDKGAVLLLTKPAPRLVIGDYVTIGRNSIISVKGACEIGSYTLIGPDVQIQDSNHSTARDNLIKFQRAKVKPIKIGCDCWIGAGAKVLAGVTIGTGAVIGANAVVTKDIPNFAIAVGCPAKVIKFREESDDDDTE